MWAISELRKRCAQTRPVILLLCVGVWALFATSAYAIESEPEDFGDLDIEMLSRIRIVSATLTPTPTRLIPAKTTVINADTIAQSGARNLNELLDIYAANTQLILHNTHQAHFGIRGIISDRDDKYLLRVNDKVMNNRFIVGAESERGVPLLGDFDTVTLVHGPASATYGAGALAGVLNLNTYNGMTFQGSDFALRQGFWNRLTAGEARYGRKLDDKSGVFIYAGLADQSGADQKDSPYVFSKSYTTPGSTSDVVAGEPVSFPVSNLDDGGGFTKAKFHASYVSGPMEYWLRYTQDGAVTRPMRVTLESVDNSLTKKGRKSLNQQLTASAKYKEKLSSTVSIEALVSYDRYMYRLWLYDLYPESDDRLEEELYGRLISNISVDKNQSVALGVEYSHMRFDGGPVGYGPAPGVHPIKDQWETDTVSLLAEHQLNINNQWSTFASARVDKHSYTEWLFSPRLAAVYTPDKQNTMKFIAARAVRRSGDGELRQEQNMSVEQGTVETLDSLELLYERKHNSRWRMACSLFVEENDAIGFNAAENHSVAVGKFRVAGIEPEVVYKTASTQFKLSHGYTQLLDATLESSDTVQSISAEPYGYGNDLANWANHITKLSLEHKLNDRWSGNTSLRIYWGFPGAKDLAEWNNDRTTPVSYALSDPGYNDAFGPSVFWNAGAEYRPQDDVTFRADAYNILGWFDEKLNKRLYYSRGTNYSVEAAAVMLSARIQF